MRRRHPPGSHPDSFAERLIGRGVPGDVGQFVLFDHRFDSVGDPSAQDRMGWPIDELGTPIFDWAPGDGATAYRGGAMTVTGAPSYSAPTPWRGIGGSGALSAELTSTARLMTTGHVLEGDDLSDLVVMALVHTRGPTSIPVLLWDAGTTRGLYLYVTPAWLFNTAVAGNGWATGSTAIAVAPGWNLLTGVIIRATDQTRCWIGATQSGVSAGGLAGWGGVGLHGYAGYSLMSPSRIARVVAWGGVGTGGLITVAFMQRLVESLFGVRPRQGAIGSTYARASTRCSYPAGPTDRIHILGAAVPPAGSAEGMGADEQIVSVTSKNHGLVAADIATHITPGTDAGLTVSLVDDSANLGPASEAGPNVVRLQNPTGGTLYQRLGNAIGGAPATSWASIRAREVAGPCRLGWQTAGGAFTQVAAALTASYGRTYGTALPGAATDLQCIELPAGADVYIILWCAGLGARVPDEVPSMAAAGASATVVQGVLTTTHTPSDATGCIEADLVPRLWGGATAPAASPLVSRSGGATGLLALDGAGNLTTTDGTTTPSASVTEADGVAETIRASHDGGGQHVTQVGGTAATGAYDGALAQSGTLTLLGSARAVRRLRVYRNARRHSS